VKRALILILLAILPACAGTTGLDWCKYSNARRATYTTAIHAADAYAASGRVVPYELAIGRLAAVTALQALDARCPVVG
jgi:hypothetical protein